MKNFRHSILALSFLLMILIGSGCLSNGTGKKSGKSTKTVSGLALTSDELLNPATGKLVISNFSLADNGATGNVSFCASTAAISLICPTLSTAPVTDFCNTTTKPCVCRFTWEHINTETASITPYTRVAETQVSGVQPWGLTCDMPDAYALEIPVGTDVRIEIYRAAGNPSLFTTNVWKSPKGGDKTDYNFTDNAGNKFHNIKRYTCFEKIMKRRSLKSGRIPSVESPNGSEVLNDTIPLANRFCIPANAGQNGCPQVEEEASSQSYYYNLFTSASSANVNPSNHRYECPTVEEAVTAGEAAVSTGGFLWPYDRTFALALRGSKDFPVPVEAPSILGGTGNPASAPMECTTTEEPSAGGGGVYGDPNSISKRCIGWAKKPNPADGSCPSIVGSDGKKKRLYRLRRFIVEYPPHFESNGKIVDQPRAIDTVYVIDRPIKTSDPNIFYTMQGPKPCPFAYFSKSDGVYMGTNSEALIGTSPDGVFFPNRDSGDPANPSCSAAIPVVRYSSTSGLATSIGIATTHASNDRCWNLVTGTSALCNAMEDTNTPHLNFQKLAVRPIRERFWPHYVEDTSFQACAPLADPFVDAPLTVYRPSLLPGQTETNWRWCARAYPSRNGYLIDQFMDQHPGASPGWIDPYSKFATSPDWLGSSGAALQQGSGVTLPACQSSLPLIHAYANRCDRTANLSFSAAPLLAPMPNIMDALRTDNSFSCAITWDNGNGLIGRSPASYSGCCRVKSSAPADEAASRIIQVEPKQGTTYDATNCPSPNLNEIF